MRTSIVLVSTVFVVAAAFHGHQAWRWSHLELPVGLWLNLCVYALGLLFCVQGLLCRRVWARCFAISIALAALMQISTMAVSVLFGRFSVNSMQIWSGLVQWAVCAGVIALLARQSVRQSFEESSRSPWDFHTKSMKLLRLASIAGLASIPMLFSMAAHAVYSSQGHCLAIAAGITMALSIAILAQGRTFGLVLMALAGLLGLVSTILIFATMDTNPSFAGQEVYTSQTAIAAAAALPGLLLGPGALATFLPRMFRFAAGKN